MGLTVLRNLDLALLALALPVFLVAGWPLLGYGATAAAWLAQRAIQAYATRRALATGDRRAAMGVIAGTMVGRIWLVGLAVLGAGLVEREAGVAAGRPRGRAVHRLLQHDADRQAARGGGRR